MLAQLRLQYPQSCLISELLEIKHGKYIVKVLVQIEGVTIATGLGSGETVEIAEDRARERVFLVLGLGIQSPAQGLAANALTPLVPTPVLTPPVMAAVSVTTPAPAVITPVAAPAVVPPPAPEIKTPEIKTPEISTPISIASSPKEITPELTQEALPVKEITPPAPTPVPEKIESKPDKVVPLHVVPDTQPLESLPPLMAIVPDPEPLDFEAEKEEKKAKAKTTPVAIPDIKDVMAKTEIEIRRLGWTTQQGRNFLLQRYGKRARTLLSDEELLDFLSYLEDQPVAE